MKKTSKNLILGLVLVLLLLVVGVTYAFFTYENGTQSDIVTGQIYMNYEETSTISLTGVFPETKAQALSRQDENGVFEFTITGRNTSKYPVYYEIDLLDGGVITGKTEQSTKILPEHIRIYLERDGEPLVDGMTYKDFNNRRIYVDTVPANQTTNIEHKYTLRMWIDENVTISDTDTSADYTTSEWNDSYASLKVRVVGDFEYKEAATDASCFTYNVIPAEGYIVYDYPIITLDTSVEKVEACMANMMDDLGEDLSTAQDGYQSFCEGIGTADDYGYLFTLKGDVGSWYSDGGTLEEIQGSYPVVSDITYETRYYELNTSEEAVNSCKEYIMDWEGVDYSDAKDGYQSFCEGTGIWWNENIFGIYDYDSENEDGDYLRFGLIERNVITQVETLQDEIEITNYDETCGTDVIIPSTIEGLSVARIADANRDTAPFGGRGITSVKFPNTLRYIGFLAFDSNNLTEITIPDSVTEIGESAFYNNDLNNIEIGTGITSIGDYAFDDNPLVTVNIKSNPSLGEYSFASSIQNTFQTFQYGGTCTELNQYSGVFGSKSYYLPRTIITTDGNSCDYEEGIK